MIRHLVGVPCSDGMREFVLEFDSAGPGGGREDVDVLIRGYCEEHGIRLPHYPMTHDSTVRERIDLRAWLAELTREGEEWDRIWEEDSRR